MAHTEEASDAETVLISATLCDFSFCSTGSRLHSAFAEKHTGSAFKVAARSLQETKPGVYTNA